MENIQLIDATERYLRGEMSEAEVNAFEELRKKEPEIDQFVVEHHFFSDELSKYARLKRFRAQLYDVHHSLQETGEISHLQPKTPGKLIMLWTAHRRKITVAASITALVISGITLLLSPKTQNREIEELRRKVSKLEVRSHSQDAQLKVVKQKIDPNSAVTFGGTCFLIDPKGVLVTSAHVVDNAKQLFVQNTKGEDFRVVLLHVDKSKDLAILQIEDEDFSSLGNLPYRFKRSNSDLAEPIFTLGFPKDEIVYGEGYLSALSGLNGDTLSSQITISANPGNSGGPVINTNGEVIGIINARKTAAEDVVFAINSRQLLRIIDGLNDDFSSTEQIKIPAKSTLKGLSRIQQVKKIEPCIFMVKVVQ